MRGWEITMTVLMCLGVPPWERPGKGELCAVSQSVLDDKKPPVVWRPHYLPQLDGNQADISLNLHRQMYLLSGKCGFNPPSKANLLPYPGNPMLRSCLRTHWRGRAKTWPVPEPTPRLLVGLLSGCGKNHASCQCSLVFPAPWTLWAKAVVYQRSFYHSLFHNEDWCFRNNSFSAENEHDDLKNILPFPKLLVPGAGHKPISVVCHLRCWPWSSKPSVLQLKCLVLCDLLKEAVLFWTWPVWVAIAIVGSDRVSGKKYA